MGDGRHFLRRLPSMTRFVGRRGGMCRCTFGGGGNAEGTVISRLERGL